MRVETVVTPNNKLRNTLRAYCYHLKLFFEYLEQEQLDYRDIGLDEMAAFMRWLQNPFGNKKVSPYHSGYIIPDSKKH